MFLSVLLLEVAFCCTTAIVSGKYTVDGRPLLFKNRDTGFAQNKLMYLTDGKYDYTGILQNIIPIENTILKKAELLNSDLFKNGSDPDKIKKFIIG